MKYCLIDDGQADQLRTDYRNKNYIFDLIEKNSKKTIIIVHDIDAEEKVFEEYKSLYVLSKRNIIIELSYYDNAYLKCKELEIPFFFNFKITTFYELNAVAALGPCYICLGAPIFFDLDKVKKMCNIPIRVVANYPKQDPFERDYWNGCWIRPEDVDKYEKYIDVIEFEARDKKHQDILYKIYAEEKKWELDLSMLITGLKPGITGRYLDDVFGTNRINCGQKCESGRHCRLCMRLAALSDPEIYQRFEKL